MGTGQSNNQSEGHLYALIWPEGHTWGGLLLFQRKGLSEGAIWHFITAALRDRLILVWWVLFFEESDGELRCAPSVNTHKTYFSLVISFHQTRPLSHVIYFHPVVRTSTRRSCHFHRIDQTWRINTAYISVLWYKETTNLSWWAANKQTNK